MIHNITIGVPVLWKVKHSYKKEIIQNSEVHNYYLTILYGNNRYSIKVDLEYAGIQLRGVQYETLWPLYLVAFEKYLRDQNIRINVIKPQNEFNKLPFQFSFFEGMTEIIENKITDFDLTCVGNLKDLLDLFLRHFFEFEQKVNGLVLEYNKNQIFPQWKLINVKKSQKKLDRFIAMSIEGKKNHKFDFKKHKQEYELSLQENERILQNNLVRFMKENHLLGVFIKRSTGGYYYLLIVKVNFRQSNDISTQIVNGQLLLSDFSFYITGRNLGTYQTILPLEIHASQVMKYFKSNTLIREINKFFLKKRLSNRWITILVNFFQQHLCLTIPKTERTGINTQKSNKIQKLIFRDIMEIKRRIQCESQKQVLLQNPFNDYFLLEQVNSKQPQQKVDKPQSDNAEISLNSLSKDTIVDNINTNNIVDYKNLVNDNFDSIYKEFYKTQRDDNIQKNDYSLFQEDDELDKKYEEGTYQAQEEILKVPAQEELVIQELQEKIVNLNLNQSEPQVQKNIQQGNQNRRKNNIYVINNQLDLQSQLEGFWRLSNLFGNGRCLQQTVFFSSRGTYLWIRIKMDIIKGIMIAQISDYKRNETYKQIIKNQKVKQLLINMTTLVPESMQNVFSFSAENLKQIAFQGILEKEKTLLGQKIKIKIQREEDTLKNPVILANKDSIKNHLLIDSIELKKHYDVDEYTSLLIHKQLGKIICSLKVFILNKARDSQLINLYLFSKHYQFKIILTFDDLYQLHPILYSNFYKQYNKINAQKLISLIMNRLQLVPTVQGKVPCFMNFLNTRVNQKELIDHQERLKNSLDTTKMPNRRNSIYSEQNKGQFLLRYKRNRFVKTSHNQQICQQQLMLEDYVQQSRVIFQGIKQFQGEYCIVTVSKDIILRYWVFNIYIPKTCRVLVSYFNNSDMMDCSEEFLIKQMSQKIIYFFENPQMTPFKSYRDFIKRIGLQNNGNKKETKHIRKSNADNSIPPSLQQNKQELRINIDIPKVSELVPERDFNLSKKHSKQRKESIQQKNANQFLDIKFKFNNFAEKFNNLREVFEPGIQKKRSISLDSLPSQSSNSLSISTPKQSPIQHKYPRDGQKRLSKLHLESTNNIFNFNSSKIEQFDFPIEKSVKLKSNKKIPSSPQQHQVLTKSQTSRAINIKQFSPTHVKNSNQSMTSSQLQRQNKLQTNMNLFESNFNQNKQSKQKYDMMNSVQLHQKERNNNRRRSAFYFKNNDSLESHPAFNNGIQQMIQSRSKLNRQSSLSYQNNNFKQVSNRLITMPYENHNIHKKEEDRKISSHIGEKNKQTDNFKFKNTNSPIKDPYKDQNQMTFQRNLIEENKKFVNKFFHGDLYETKRASLIVSGKKLKNDILKVYQNIQKQNQKQYLLENKESISPTRQNKRKQTFLVQEEKKKLGQQDPKIKKGLQYYMKKHFIKILVVIHFQQYIDMKRVGNKVKIQRTQKFFNLTNLLDDAFTQKQHNVRINNLWKYIEMRLWENLINSSRLEADLQSEHMLFCVENSKLPLHELMYHDFMQIDNNTNHEFNTEICINFIDIVSNKGLKQARKRMKSTNKKMKTKKEMMENFYFTPLDWISYPMTTHFNMYIQNVHLEEGFIQTDVINLREILNIYIAEGYYKYQTNYINSKLNYSDIKSLCQFIIHKMKTSNFLNLMKSQISGNNEGFSQKFSIEENIRQKANYMKRIKNTIKNADQQTNIKNVQSNNLVNNFMSNNSNQNECEEEQQINEKQKILKNLKSGSLDSKSIVIKKTTILNPSKGLILKSQYTPSLKEFKFVVQETNKKSNTTRYKQFEFFQNQIQFLDILQKSQFYQQVLDKVVLNFKNQMSLYHDINN